MDCLRSHLPREDMVDLPLTNETIAAVADFKAKFRKGDNPAAAKA